MIPRTITKEVFCHVFSADGVAPICYATLFSYYVQPYLSDLSISEEEYRSYSRGLPYHVGWKLINIHKITEEEITEAIQHCQKQRRTRRKAERRAQANTPALPFPE